MSASTRVERAKSLGPARVTSAARETRRWVGFDLSGANDPRRAKYLVPLLLMALVIALGVAALRIDLIRTRYAVAAAATSCAAPL